MYIRLSVERNDSRKCVYVRRLSPSTSLSPHGGNVEANVLKFRALKCSFSFCILSSSETPLVYSKVENDISIESAENVRTSSIASVMK